jgi:predicted Ser/Thr protein kinase
MDPDSWRQAKSVLEAALLCPPDEREALIAARCADATLRREVLACLHENDEGFLESALTISHTFDTATSGEDVEPPPDIPPGERIGRYKVEKRLGAGGMGAVFLCTDTELRRPVALKCLISSASAVDVRARLRHEASAAAQLNHPNIAAVHDVVEHDGRPFLVMEYVEGEDLAHALRRERPSLDRILAIGRQLASALTAAHAKNIIHRDLKPANIQLMPDGSVKILDFGVAQAIWLADTEPAGGSTTTAAPVSTLATMRTERGSIRHPGTPAYMSPEQMFGKPIDGRSDIYSLGVILYEMATGHRPYSTDDPLDVVLALSHKLLRPSGMETHLPEAINDIIGKMLTVDLDQRYQTAEEVETALLALMAPEAAAPLQRSIIGIKTRIALRAVGVALSVLAGITVLGFIQTAAFNVTLGRVAPFDQESRWVWLETGFRSLVLPTLYLILILSAVGAVRFAVRLLTVSRRIDHLVTDSITRTTRLGSRLGLDDPAALGQVVAGLGVVILAATLWRFWPFVLAVFSASISSKPAAQFIELQPKGHGALDAQLYVFAMTVIIVFFGVGIIRIRRLRALQRIRQGGGPLAVVITMLVFTVLLCQVPYRIEWKNSMPLIEMAGKRCYLLGENEDRWLIHCPEASLPRNRVVNRNEPGIEALGRSQSLFTPPETSP